MLKTKVLYVIPGYRESTHTEGYQKIRKAAEQKGYKVKFWEPNWRYSTISKLVSEFSSTKKDTEEINILGFSLGAMIGILSSEKLTVRRLFCCSLSPYFKDDLKKIPNIAHKILGKRRIKDFSTIQLPKKINSNIYILVGEKEWPLTIARSKTTFSCIKSKKSFFKIIPDTEHNISSKKYIDQIKKLL